MSDNNDWLDEALEALARDDEAAVVPPAVQTAVMAEWNSRSHDAAQRRWGGRSIAAAIAAGIAAAACGAAAVWLLGIPRSEESTRSTRQVPMARGERVTARPEPAVRASEGPDAVPQTRVRTPLPQAPSVADGQVEDYVLVEDPFADVMPLHLVRVRMSRSTFASLGVPITNPDADGVVEVEMLVGDDGVARTIRRAAFVSDRVDR